MGRLASTSTVALLLACAMAACGDQPSKAQSVDQTQALQSASRHEQAHDYAQCIADYTRVLSANSVLVQAYVGRAGCRQQQGDSQGAIADYSRAIQLSPGDPKLYVLRAANEMAVGDNTTAYADYKKVMTLPAPDPAQFVDAAQGLERMGFLADARAVADIGIRTYDHYWPLHTTRADIEKELGDEREAFREFDIALSLASGTNQLWPLEDRGGYYVQLRLYNLALADFNKTILLDPTHYDFFEGRARAKLGLADLKGAEADLTTAINIVKAKDPGNGTLLASLLEERGGVYLSERSLAKALQDFTEALNDTPAEDKVGRARLTKLINSTQ